MVHLEFDTAVFFEMSKGLVIIYVKKGWGGRGGEEEEKIYLKDQNPFLPDHVNGKWASSLIKYLHDNPSPLPPPPVTSYLLFYAYSNY